LNSNKKIVIALFVFVSLVFAVLLVQRANETNANTPATSMEEQHDAHEEENEEHEDHDNHEERGGGKVLKLTETEIQEFGVRINSAGPGQIKKRINLPGEVNINADRLAHIVPQVSGLVRKIYKTLGDRVKAGELMAVLESRELADAKSAYFVATERQELAEANFRREKDLWKKKITAEQEYLEAKQALAEANIELSSAEQKLHTLGFSEAALKKLSHQLHMKFTHYEIRSPLNGTVIEKHITIGEKLMNDSKAFTIADLSTIWINLSVYQKDMPFVGVGQKVNISTAGGLLSAEGTISYVGPLVGEKTRTATARIVLPNPDRRWKPGLFISAKVAVSEVNADVVIPKSAIQTIDDEPVVFVLSEKSGEEGFTPRHVKLGRSDDESVEILSSLQPGERYVSEGAFVLKAEMSKGKFGDGHAH
jgi:cobalt-zinc-cadmium efflux system membrane fusion protein